MKKIFPISVLVLLILSGGITTAISISDITLQQKNYEFDEYKMIIIAPNEFSSEIQPLIDHKNSHGINTLIQTTQDIYKEYTGRDEPEQIKYFIKYAKEEWNISYVLLIGGRKDNTFEWYVPVRYVELDDGTGRFKKHISDLYFADLYKDEGEFEDWDNNGDDIIAQWPKDKFDLYPDVYIGRLPCRNKAEISTVVQKIIDYENNANGETWFNRVIMVGGDTFPEYEGYEGEITCDFAANYMQDFEIIKLYTSTGALTGSEELKNEINNGCGFLFTRAKGGTDRVRVNTPGGTELIVLNNDDIQDLKNKNKYPVIILAECQHGQFDIARKKVRNSHFNIFTILEEIMNRIFRINHKNNKGLGGARNTGMKHASGDYICFVDSDDFVSEEFVERLYKQIIKDDSDMTICGFWCYENNTTKKCHGDIIDKVLTVKDNKSNVVEIVNQYRSASWFKMYKRSLLTESGIHQDENRYYEDVVFWLKAVYFSNTISIMPTT